MPANRVLVNTPAPQGSTGITTNVFPSMTLGCGAAAGNITSDNVGPLHLINIKRLAYVVRKPEEAFEMPLDYKSCHRSQRSGRRRGALPGFARNSGEGGGRSGVLLRIRQTGARQCLRRCGGPLSRPPRRRQSIGRVWLTGAGVPHRTGVRPTTRATAPKPVDFVCENDVRDAIRDKRKIYIGPRTIVTPSARDLAGPSDILVLA
jgi:acetaldehyde dehydrogenase (acetylating)